MVESQILLHRIRLLYRQVLECPHPYCQGLHHRYFLGLLHFQDRHRHQEAQRRVQFLCYQAARQLHHRSQCQLHRLPGHPYFRVDRQLHQGQKQGSGCLEAQGGISILLRLRLHLLRWHRRHLQR